jgi:hypothetical protein
MHKAGKVEGYLCRIHYESLYTIKGHDHLIISHFAPDFLEGNINQDADLIHRINPTERLTKNVNDIIQPIINIMLTIINSEVKFWTLFL